MKKKKKKKKKKICAMDKEGDDIPDKVHLIRFLYVKRVSKRNFFPVSCYSSPTHLTPYNVHGSCQPTFPSQLSPKFFPVFPLTVITVISVLILGM
jgi:hypothetical protein